MASASQTSGSGSSQGGSPAPVSVASHNTLLDYINQECIVHINDITCAQYCFNLQADFALKNEGKNKPKYHRQYETVGGIMSGAMNTSGGILAVISLTQVKPDVVDKWSNTLPSQLSFMPTWAHKECVSIHFINLNTPAVVFLVKKSPQTITHNSHLFIRQPEGSSQLADTEAVLAVLTRATVYRQQPMSGEFIIPSSYTYGEQLPSESETLEYKHWSKARTVADLIRKLKADRTTKGLFSLANNQTKSYLIIGVSDDYRVMGLVLSDANKSVFSTELSQWMVEDDDGNLRIWGEEGRAPVNGTDWDITFVPVNNCPNGQLRVLIIVTMYPCFGGLFERCPECYILADDGKIEMMSFSEWKENIIEEAKLSARTATTAPLVPSAPSVAITTSSATTAPSAARAPSVTTAPSVVTTSSVSIAPSATSAPSVATTEPSAAATDTYMSASWTRSSNWEQYIVDDDNDNGNSSDADLPYDQRSMMKMEKGINLSPSLDKLCLKYPASSSHIKSMFEEMKLQCGPVPACAVAFRSWPDSFNHQASIVPPAGHIMDTLMISQNKSLHMWVCVETQGNAKQQKNLDTYAQELCRVLQKHLLFQKINIEQYQAVNVQITPVLFYADVNKSNTALRAGDLIAQLNSANMSSICGVRLEGLQSGVISLLIKHVWVRDRVGRDKTYHLTKQQVNGLRQFFNQQISLIEAAPGCGKSVMAISVCQIFRRQGEVLYISPSRGFTSLIDYQDIAIVKHVHNDWDMREVIAQIRDTDYHIVVIDDIQAMDCSLERRRALRSTDPRKGRSAIFTDLWRDLLEAVYSRYHTRVLFLMDSQYQDYHQYSTCSRLKGSIQRFCENKRIPSPSSITLSANMRNSRKVFTFLKAQILKEPGVHLVNAYLSSGHSVDGDDVVVRYLDDPLLDAPENELIKLVQGLIGPQNDRGYEAKDTVILVDNKSIYSGSEYEPDSVLRRIFKKHTSLKVHTARDLPHEGLVIDTVDEFTGMEATLCLVLLSERHDNRSHTNMQYRMFVASRGIMRTELLMLRPLDRDVTSMMALEKTDTAEKCVPPQAVVMWKKKTDTDTISSMTFLLHHGRPVILYACTQGSDYKLLAMTMACEPVTDLPPAFTAVSRPIHVCVSRDQARAVVRGGFDSYTTLVRQGENWQKHKTYSGPSDIGAVTITPDGGVALVTKEDRLYKYDESGVRQWDVELPESVSPTLGVGPDGALYVAQPLRDTISCYGPDGSQLGSISISKPLSVCWADEGLLVGHVRCDDVGVISVVSPDGRRRRHVMRVGGIPWPIATYQHFVVARSLGGNNTGEFDVSPDVLQYDE